MRFTFAAGTDDVAGDAERDAVRRAFDSWAAVVPVAFREVGQGQSPHVRVAWIPVDDRPGNQPGVLAYSAFPPQLTGLEFPLPFKFIDRHEWNIDGRLDAFDIETTALHEIGHLLGLAHSEDPLAAMFAFSNPGLVMRALGADDIAAVRGLYRRIERRGDSGTAAGTVTALAAVRTGPRRIVTAVRSGGGRQLLISWDVGEGGGVGRVGDSGTAGIRLPAAALEPDPCVVDLAMGARLVTASRAAEGGLVVASWDVAASGPVRRSGGTEGRAGSARHVRIAALSPTLFLTACRNAAGRLLLITWRLTADGSLVRLGDSGSAAGAVSEISLLRFGSIGAGHLLITAVRDGGGRLLVVAWRITSAGAIERRGDSGGAAGKATLVRAVQVSGRLVTAMRADDGSVLMVVWQVAADGRTIERLFGSRHDGEIEDLALMARPDGRAVTAVRNASKKLQMIPWTIEESGVPIRAFAPEQSAGQASLVTLVSEPLGDDAPIATAVRTGAGTLKIITWDD